MNIFIYNDGQFYGSPTGYMEKYNEALKEKPVLSLTEKQNIIGKYYNTLNDVNAKVTCSEDA